MQIVRLKEEKKLHESAICWSKNRDFFSFFRNVKSEDFFFLFYSKCEECVQVTKVCTVQSRQGSSRDVRAQQMLISGIR